MKYDVTQENTYLAANGTLTADASMLGLPPGSFPVQLTTLLGTCTPFVRMRINRNGDGDVTVVHYRQSIEGLQLDVFND